ncbi:MAG: UDP-N-acetylmuramoyl-L-alanyl-D-glutamate--2,6-diaminopimelate ligase [Cytophagales bacterium]|nr:UDP-N-acetylmuramoyl-L-alanyl-D-glutamate--2,6-diaminopimelate ligase [Cytophagales bacterium]
MESLFSGIQFDSRKVESGDVFVAVEGTQTDGHQYIDIAVERGAACIVCQHMPDAFQEGVSYFRVENSSECLGKMASCFYGNPSAALQLVAVTGTNGKTTTVTLLYQLFKKLGYKTGLLSTVENRIDDRVVKASHTTGDALQINRLLAEMVKEGVTHCFMEASSHAVDQNRMAGLSLDGAVFTNITHDHLDYHETFSNYIKAKKKLFDGLDKKAFALVNLDDKRGAVMLQNTKAKQRTFALKNPADYKGKLLTNSMDGLELDINGLPAWFRLVGDFNAYNLLSAYAVAVELGEAPEQALTALTVLDAAPGRFERVPNAQNVTVVVDYAHTPDALENVLNTIQNIKGAEEKVITVVGCGGNRDKDKRPKMAGIACRLSDRVVLTSDNPRFEDPSEILKDMESGIPTGKKRGVLSVLDRKEGIKAALMLAGPHDIVLVAGKGHETYQEIEGVKHDFDDRAVIRELLE